MLVMATMPPGARGSFLSENNFFVFVAWDGRRSKKMFGGCWGQGLWIVVEKNCRKFPVVGILESFGFAQGQQMGPMRSPH